MKPFGFFLLLILLCASWPFASTSVFAQAGAAEPRITGVVDESQLTTLKGNTHPLARAEFDRGSAPPDLPMQRMLLVLRRSPGQEAALQKLLDDQQDKASPSFHKWLTPVEFGQQFGPADQDIQIVTGWLQAHGFQVARVSKGHTVIEFAGDAAQVQEAFHTPIHKFTVNGEDHWANTIDPQIPTALTPVVAGVHTLHNFLKKPQIQIVKQKMAAKLVPGAPGKPPQVTFPGNPAFHALGPADYTAIYNIPDSYNGAPDDGFGAEIAVVGRTDINIQDVARFRDVFNLPENSPQVFEDGPDPGDLGGAEEAEAVLDTTWSGAIAQGANVWLYVSASTNTTDGVDLSALYIIDNGVAPVMTESFGSCEATATSAEATDLSQLAEEAAAQGITYIAAAGDTGSAGCDNLSEAVATGPLSVSLPASTPFTVAVGGTEFNEHGSDSLYWNSTNNSDTLASALSYIPEDVWNESCTAAQCGNADASIAAGGGGASVYFAKPSWQSGVSGLPNDGMRDVPDVALTAAGHDPYLLCLDGSCTPDAQGNFSFALVAGTSASAPSFAGIMALAHEAILGLNPPGFGQVNYVLYQLAASENPASCNGSGIAGLPASTCVFNDVTVGNNAVPGEVGYGTDTALYQSGVGYDLASGLGSINVTNLINNWAKVTFNATTTTLSLSPTTFTHGTSVDVNITVTSASGTPTGDVTLFRSGYSPASASLPIQGNFFTLSSAGVVTNAISLLPGGSYTVGARYAGDGKYAPSDSSNITLTVSPEASSVAISALTANSQGNPIPFTGGPYGSFIYLRADINSASGFGIPTGSVNFTDTAGTIPGNPYALNSQGNAATPNGLFTLGIGTHSITAAYGGDPSFNPSASPPLSFTISQASTTTTATAAVNTQGTGAIFTATVATNSGGTPPTGTVTFSSGGSQLGSAPVIGGVNATNGTAQASVTLTDSQLAKGQYSIAATYSGDANYTGSTSTPIALSLQPDFSLSFSAASLTISAPGNTALANLTVSVLDGFSGTLSFNAGSCAGLPAESSCSFNPASVTGSGTTQLTVATTGPHQTAVKGTRLSQGFNPWTTGLAVMGIFLVGLPTRRRRWHASLSLLLLAFLIAFPACGGGSGGGGGGGGSVTTDPGTPVGTYTVTITASSGSLTHTTSFQLVVQ